MSTTHPSFADELGQCNNRLDCILTERFGVTLRAYKLVKALTNLAAVGTGIYAISEGADPLTAFVIVGAIVVGPDAIETAIANNGGGGGENG